MERMLSETLNFKITKIFGLKAAKLAFLTRRAVTCSNLPFAFAKRSKFWGMASV